MLYCLATLWVFPSAPSGTLTMLRLASPCSWAQAYYLLIALIGESDGRCVRASGPFSVGLSIPLLLLNPPSDAYFSATSVFTASSKCSPFLPLPYATPRPDVLGYANFAYYRSLTG